MIPGMTERDRLANDVRVLEWLADATVGPVGIGARRPLTPAVARKRFAFPLGAWRRGLAAAFVLGQRIRAIDPTPGASGPESAVSPLR